VLKYIIESTITSLTILLNTRLRLTRYTKDLYYLRGLILRTSI